MINPQNILPGMPVISSDANRFATVDFMAYEDTFRLRDREYVYHYVPVSWVVSTENGKVVIDRSAQQAMDEWSMNKPRRDIY